MNAITLTSVKAALRFGVLTGAAICVTLGQTLINLGTQSRNVDFSNAPSTRPVKTGSSLPATCNVGELFFNTSAAAGQNLYACSSSNTWSAVSTPPGLGDPGANGLVQRTAPNTTTAVAAPAGTIVGTTDTQTLTNKSIDASEINTGTMSAARMPAFSGDISVAAGTTNATLPAVNSSPGAYGDSAHSVQLSVDAKGRVTGISQVPINTGMIPAAQMPAFSGDISTTAGTTAATLATVNLGPGTYGDASHALQLTVDAKGRVTAISQIAMLGGNGNSSIAAGPLASISSTCTAGTLYFATDQVAGQQIYACSAANTWTQLLSFGPSGALAMTNGSLDIVPSVVPVLSSANTFTAMNTFANGVQIQGTSAQPTCSSTVRGLLWFQNNGTSKDGIQACVYNGTSYAWISLY